MKDQILLPEGGFYKANLHCHTTISDGKLTPEETKREYQKQGYSIIAFTDHREYRWHTELDDENFLSLAALEVDLTEKSDAPNAWPRLKTYHLNLFDTDPAQSKAGEDLLPHVDYHDLDGLNAYIARMNSLGFLVCYNHPYWSLQTYDDYKGLRGLHAMEIYNHGCEHDGLYGFHPQSYDEMLRTGQRLCALATDDNHDAYPIGAPENDSFGGFVQIAADGLSYGSVIEALKAGRFYWSMGPELRGVSIKGDVLSIDTSPVEKIFVLQEGRNCYSKITKPGEPATHAEFQLSGREGWFRVEVRDGRGLYAGTNAYYISDLG